LRIMITGAGGQLGTELSGMLAREHDVLPLTRRELDVTDKGQVFETVRMFAPHAIVHAAAFTGVDCAETDVEGATRVNASGTRYIAEAAEAAGSKLVYISTDYVFDGRAGRPYEERDDPSPINVYGLTKLLGEAYARQLCSRHFILRTAWLYGQGGHNFVKTILLLARRQQDIRVVRDAIGSPTYTYDLSRLIAGLIGGEQYGLYHAVNEGCCSRYEFAQAIVEEAGELEASVSPIDSQAYPQPAARPCNSALKTTAVLCAGELRMRPWRDALRAFLAELEGPPKR
jgi:dTDP-4-dehydrorhamnose reductase